MMFSLFFFLFFNLWKVVEGEATRLAELTLIFIPEVYNVAVSDTLHSKL